MTHTQRSREDAAMRLTFSSTRHTRGQHSNAYNDTQPPLFMDDQALTHAFQQRRHRMEAASRLTLRMLERVRSVVDSDENQAYMMLLETVGPPTTAATTTGAPNGKAREESKMSERLKLSEEILACDAALALCSQEVFINDEITQKLQKLRDMRVEQRAAAELQTRPAFQLEEPEMVMPTPPDTFTSTSLAFALEALAVSVTKLVAASDKILVNLADLDRTNAPPVFKELKVLSLHSKHACRCYTSVLQHLKQYEACEEATQEAIVYELANAREAFLMRKEMLTAQEQKQKVAEEHLFALRHRLNNIDSLCRMWSAILLDVVPPLPFIPSASLVMRSSPLYCHESFSSARSLSVTKCGSIVKGVGAPRHASFSRSTSLLGNSWAPHRPNARPHASPPADEPEAPTTPSSFEDDGSVSVDAMEARVSRFWTNPYVMKAQQSAGRMCRRPFSRERAPTVTEVVCLPAVSLSDTAQVTTSPGRFAGDTHRTSRTESIYKATYASEGMEKTAADIRLISLLRNLLRLTAGAATHERSSLTVLSSKPDESADVMELGCENDNASAAADPLAESEVVSAANVSVEVPEVDEPTRAMLESARNLLKFLEETQVAPA